MATAGPGQIIVTWKDNSTTEDGFRVLRESVSGESVGSATYQEIGETGPNVERWVDDTTKAGTPYRYSVAAFNAQGTSELVAQGNPPLERGSLLFALNVRKSGAGLGTVTSVPVGIDCGTDCYELVEAGTSVVLSASPAVGSSFYGWSGACSGLSTTCAVEMSENREVGAVFLPDELPPGQAILSVAALGPGTGLITSEPSGIHCGTTCDGLFDVGEAVKLTAQAGDASVFTGWEGSGCGGLGACVVTVQDAHAVSATFELKTYTLSVTVQGSGTVTSVPSGIDCGLLCAEEYDAFTTVTLTAAAGDHHEFRGWAGACVGTAATCVVDVTSDVNVTARFGDTHIVVTSTTGDTGGPECTLRDAITAANTDTPTGGCRAGHGSDTIQLPEGAVISLSETDNVFSGPNGLPSITSPITIEGHGATIERAVHNPRFRIFHVGAEGDLTIEDTNIRYGTNEFQAGGGVRVEGGRVVLLRTQFDMNTTAVAVANGTAVITDSVVFENDYYFGSVAGILIEDSNSTVTIQSSDISGNLGLGIVNRGLLYLTEVRISANYWTEYSAGGLVNYGSAYLDRVTYHNHQSESGGALSNAGYMSIKNSVVSGNYAVEGVGGIWNGGTMELIDSEVTYNVSERTEGGGIYNSGTLTVWGGTMTSNFAENGGGIYNIGVLDVIDAVIAGNRANADGGGIYTTSQVWLAGDTYIGTPEDGNRSGRNGGGIYDEVGHLYVCRTCVITGNIANYGGEYEGMGGGIYSTWSNFSAPDGTVFGNVPDQIAIVDGYD